MRVLDPLPGRPLASYASISGPREARQLLRHQPWLVPGTPGWVDPPDWVVVRDVELVDFGSFPLVALPSRQAQPETEPTILPAGLRLSFVDRTPVINVYQGGGMAAILLARSDASGVDANVWALTVKPVEDPWVQPGIAWLAGSVCLAPLGWDSESVCAATVAELRAAASAAAEAWTGEELEGPLVPPEVLDAAYRILRIDGPEGLRRLRGER